jgi:hypothetical protein
MNQAMKRTLGPLAFALCLGFAGSAGAAATKVDKAQKDRIEADYKAAKDHCKDLKGNAQDICKVEAKGNYHVAKAELEAQADPSPRHDAKVKTEKAEAAYQLAKEKCDDLNGNAKDVCRKDAKAAFATAKGDAKVAKTSGQTGANSAATMDQRKDASDDKLDAQYAAAKERCDAKSGQAKDNCVNDAKKKFNKM